MRKLIMKTDSVKAAIKYSASNGTEHTWEKECRVATKHLGIMVGSWEQREAYIARLEALNDKLLGKFNNEI